MAVTGFSRASSKPRGSLYFFVLVIDEWRSRGRISSTWVSAGWPSTLPPLWRQWGPCFRTGLAFYQRHEGGRQGEATTVFPLVAKRRRLSQNRALPGKSLLGELPLLSVLCVWQEGLGLRFLLRLLLKQVSSVAWRWTLGQAAARRVEWERGPAAPCPEWSSILMSPGTLSCPCLISSAVSLLWWSLPWVQSCVCLQTHLSHSIPICFLSPKNSWNSHVHG